MDTSIADTPRPFITPGQTLTGARINTAQAGLFGAPARPGGYQAFLAPTAVAARNNIVFVVDSGLRQILRYDPTQLAMTRFTEFAGTVSGMAIGPDMSLYVIDAGSRRILHFSWDGKALPAFGHDNAISRPVAIALNESTGQLFVADSLYNHVVAFNSLGRALVPLKSLEARSIEAMALGPDGLYLVDRLSRQVVVMGTDGVDRYTLGGGTLKDPQAIAVDGFNRVFVSDAFDNTIKVYESGQLAATIGGSGNVPGAFNRITFLSLDRNLLYVADSSNARIQTFHVAPPRKERGNE
jgi:DNA-binding beta-propeller fold protein YncE